ncbi:bifunctional diguanylate cyclase/phosphodiesterase [Idiomarina sp. X4]|uniref:putative bifunctional diguanylate cyclase/phosphodiesterase n=1 Tax=Idiomarina sp. X4 TaxID=2055892 RepID=UPI000C288E86|nr:EAL domain-containing protein [Idiomarina sp. X4]ATZ72827.1 bifunctional diguanylate cyclase/phosphodiesterase [Idiomarina sp. X4]
MKRFWLFIILSFALSSAGVIWFAENQHAQTVEARKRTATERLGKLRAALEGQVNSSLVTVRALRAEIKLSPNISSDRFAALMQELMTTDLPIRHVALAPNLIIQYVHPLEGNKDALGFNYRDSEIQFAGVQKAIENGDVVIDGPVQLVQGGLALIARAPVIIDNNLWGVIAVVIQIDELMENSGVNASNGIYTSALAKVSESGKRDFEFGDESVWNKDHVTSNVVLTSGRWLLATAPMSGSWVSRGPLYWSIVSIGLLLALIMNAFMYYLLHTQVRLRAALKTIDEQANFDSLTQLHNRRSFIKQLNRLTSKDSKYNSFAVLFIDLDHFKEVNDSLGHDFGDELLKVAGSRLKQQLRTEDFIARLGGDEFVVVINRLKSKEVINQLALKLNSALTKPFLLQHSQTQTSCSIGIALYPDDGLNTEQLLKNADLAMYAAKAAGRRTHYFFNDELRQRTEHQNSIHNRMRLGLKNNEFRLVYQPIVNLTSGKIEKCEALLRWTDDNGDTISPAEFIPVAESTGLIHELGQFVLEQACADWSLLHKGNMRIGLSINRSERELNDLNAAKQWLECIRQHQLPTEKVTFEITESLLMSNKQRQIQILHYLRSHGVKIATDDFGTGYSSINYLQRYPVDYLKIDRSFLNNAPENRIQVALTEALLRVARALDIDVIAEGVENKAQWEFLQRQQCDFAQGFYISHGLSLDELITFLKKWQF